MIGHGIQRFDSHYSATCMVSLVRQPQFFGCVCGYVKYIYINPCKINFFMQVVDTEYFLFQDNYRERWTSQGVELSHPKMYYIFRVEILSP